MNIFEMLEKFRSDSNKVFETNNGDLVEFSNDGIIRFSDGSPFNITMYKLNTMTFEEYTIESSEQWKDIIDFEGFYQVSNEGRVRSLDRYVDNKSGLQFVKGKIMTLQTKTNGYKFLGLRKPGEKKSFKYIHRLVAIAFIPNPLNKPEVNHKYGIKSENKILDLEWSTRKENNNHARANGLTNDYGSNSVNSKLSLNEATIIRNIFKNTENIGMNLTDKNVGRIFGVSSETIRKIRLGKSYKVYSV